MEKNEKMKSKNISRKTINKLLDLFLKEKEKENYMFGIIQEGLNTVYGFKEFLFEFVNYINDSPSAQEIQE